jgi:hypothetical protein
LLFENWKENEFPRIKVIIDLGCDIFTTTISNLISKRGNILHNITITHNVAHAAVYNSTAGLPSVK